MYMSHFQAAEMKPVSVNYLEAKLREADTYHDVYRIFYGDDYSNAAIDRLLDVHESSPYMFASRHFVMLGQPRIGGPVQPDSNQGLIEGSTTSESALQMLDSPDNSDCDQCVVIGRHVPTHAPHVIRHHRIGRPPKVRTRKKKRQKHGRSKHRKEERRKKSSQPKNENRRKDKSRKTDRKHKRRRQKKVKDRKHNRIVGVPGQIIRRKMSIKPDGMPFYSSFWILAAFRSFLCLIYDFCFSRTKECSYLRSWSYTSGCLFLKSKSDFISKQKQEPTNTLKQELEFFQF